MKAIDLVGVMNALGAHASEKLKDKSKAIRILALHEKLTDEYQRLGKMEQELVSEFVDTEAKRIPDALSAEYAKRHAELFDTDLDIAFKPLAFDVFADMELSLADIKALRPVLSDWDKLMNDNTPATPAS